MAALQQKIDASSGRRMETLYQVSHRGSAVGAQAELQVRSIPGHASSMTLAAAVKLKPPRDEQT